MGEGDWQRQIFRRWTYSQGERVWHQMAISIQDRVRQTFLVDDLEIWESSWEGRRLRRWPTASNLLDRKERLQGHWDIPQRYAIRSHPNAPREPWDTRTLRLKSSKIVENPRAPRHSWVAERRIAGWRSATIMID